jgi:hypothetical protein
MWLSRMGLSADGWHGSAIECLTKALAFALEQSALELRSAIDLAACSPETESAIRLGSC